ncbi:hypothetical protein ACIBL3_01065 [Kribbella sp. NPDC050124]|uniref:hypothetical protein n=1 Tax=Kribbella sp. NPDC050124 TaxID=3364114 RepID=UPI003798419C
MPTPTAPDHSLIAWVDESVIVGNDHLSGTYTLAAVLADQGAIDDLRTQLLALTERKIVRLHWVAESAKRRDLIAETVAALSVMAIVVVGSPVHRQKQERARRCCLEHLLYELDQLGVSQAWLESRAPSQDKRDRSLVDSARRKGLLSYRTSIEFARPLQEPMLWLPDAVAGAVTAANLGEPRWLLALSEVVSVQRIVVR